MYEEVIFQTRVGELGYKNCKWVNLGKFTSLDCVKYHIQIMNEDFSDPVIECADRYEKAIELYMAALEKAHAGVEEPFDL